jgi:hypothetical protein
MGEERLGYKDCEKYIYTSVQHSRKLGVTETDTRVLGAMVLEKVRLRSVSLCRASSVKHVSRIDTIRTKATLPYVSGIFNCPREDNKGIYFTEEEVVESMVNEIDYRSEGRATRRIFRHRGVLAQDVGFEVVEQLLQ